MSKETFTDTLRKLIKHGVDPTTRFLHNIGVTANMVTVLGLLIHLPIMWLIVQGRFRWAAVVGFLSLFDAIDGSLARLNPDHTPNGFGAFLDSTTDRIAELLIWGALSVWFYQQGELLYLTLTIATLGGALMVSYTRSCAEALGYECKVGVFTRAERYLTQCVLGLAARPDLLVIILSIGTWITVIQRGAAVWKQAKS